MPKIAVIGAGHMARVRAKAFLSASESCEICCVASRHFRNTRKFAKEFNCTQYVDNYKEVLRFRPDILLIEVPHYVQDEISLWALESGLHTLIGGCLATNVSTGLKIAELADKHNLIVEAGYEARYKEAWRYAKKYLLNGKIGEIVAIRSIALYDADPHSWYYDENNSGGMILTHMTYAFINPIRWIFGRPIHISAFSNQKREISKNKVNHETCTANLLFNKKIICNMTAGYVKPKQLEAWKVSFIGLDGGMELKPGDMDPGSITIFSNHTHILTHNFSDKRDAFVEQARVFLSALADRNKNLCLNQPQESVIDVQISEIIAKSAAQKSTLTFLP